MSDYINQCLSEHIARMKVRLEKMNVEKRQLCAQVDILQDEIHELELGHKNWMDEEEEQRHI